MLGVLVVLQGTSALFFLGDVTADFLALGFDPHTTYEGIATLALLCGVALGLVEMWRTANRMRRAENALKMASGAFADLLEDRFDMWRLTPAEAEVALLTLKGFDGPEIARLRGTADGTVRAQLGRIYAKSGCNGRGQFVSLFIDALLDDPVTGGSGREVPVSSAS
ncbi:helix-turn-helix transcriptional regulator [Seohaeicola saemankumensis]|nr:helix-turn-helix transcriptional regulator [Seohaeicola saemankumensis]MCA0872879.1 helix-turn-helix transcriptional regulator [Seohaeicola saemankumensis]